jgi:acetate CoA/acetoacetate CoA-transferase alpha subunit
VAGVLYDVEGAIKGPVGTMRRPIRLEEAIEQVPHGATLMIGGFMGVGTPSRLIEETVRQRKKDLTIISNDTARPGVGIGKLLDAKLVRKVVASHIGTNAETQRQMLAGEIEVELSPQGTLIERIRAGGYGLGGILTTTGLGTVVEVGKMTLQIDGCLYLLEKPLKADFAFVYAKQADYLGNLTYALTARNFNPLIAMAATSVMAEAQSIVPLGVIPPDAVMTPAVLVSALIATERRHG